MKLLPLLFALGTSVLQAAPLTTTKELIAAVRDGEEGATIEIGPGTFELAAPLEPKPGMMIRGAGMDETILVPAAAWNPSTETLPDPQLHLRGLDSQAYLIRLPDKGANITISDLTLRGPQVHGAIFGFANDNLHLHDLRIENFLWSGIRTLKTSRSTIRDCVFVDAGGKWKRGGIPGTDGGVSGAAIFVVWASDCEIAHNRILRTRPERERAHFGIKGRGGRRLHIHHNTIAVNFSIEFPFENLEGFEIDHNILNGVVSIPKFGGGKAPESGLAADIHHNYFTTSYAIEFVRNGVAIHHNLFDFDLEEDKGNLVGSFGKEPAPGPAIFHNNRVSNPGRGVIWCMAPFNHLTVRNNHIVTRTTATPRTQGLFGLNGNSDFSTIKIVDNIIECIGQPRPLFRNEASYAATIRNNRLINVSDTGRYENPQTDAKAGLEEPLRFQCGVHGELTVDGWETRATEEQRQD